MTSKFKAIVIGGGSMGGVFAAALINKIGILPQDLLIVERRDESRIKLANQLLCRTAESVESIDSNSFSGCQMIFLAIKPKDFLAKSAENGGSFITSYSFKPEQMIVSCMAGISVATISATIMGEPLVVRTMPNLAISLSEGVIAYIVPAAADRASRQFLVDCFTPLGMPIEVDSEKMIDSATAVSGSGPGFIAYIIEHLILGAVNAGFNSDVAQTMVMQTVRGTLAMFKNEPGLSPTALRQRVASPKGTTEAGLNELKKHHVGGSIEAAVAAARNRAEQLSLE